MTEFLADLGIPGMRIPALVVKSGKRNAGEELVADLLGYGFRVVDQAEISQNNYENVATDRRRYYSSAQHPGFTFDKVRPTVKCKDIMLGKPAMSANMEPAPGSPPGAAANGAAVESYTADGGLLNTAGTSSVDGAAVGGFSPDGKPLEPSSMSGSSGSEEVTKKKKRAFIPVEERPDVELMRRVRGKTYLHPYGFEIDGLTSMASVHLHSKKPELDDVGNEKPDHLQSNLVGVDSQIDFSKVLRHEDVVLMKRNTNDPMTAAESRFPLSSYNSEDRFFEEAKDYRVERSQDLTKAFEPLTKAISSFHNLAEFHGLNPDVGRKVTATVCVPVMRVSHDRTLDTSDALIVDALAKCPYVCDGVMLGATRTISVKQFSTYPRSPSGMDMAEHFSHLRQKSQESGRDATVSTPREGFRSGRAGPLGFPPEIREADTNAREVDIFLEEENLQITIEVLPGEKLPKFKTSGEFLSWLQDWSIRGAFEDVHLWRPLLVSVLHTDAFLQRLMLKHGLPDPHSILKIPQFCLNCRVGRKFIHWNLDLYRSSRALPPRLQNAVDSSFCPDPVEEHTVVYLCPSHCGQYYSCSPKSHQLKQNTNFVQYMHDLIDGKIAAPPLEPFRTNGGDHLLSGAQQVEPPLEKPVIDEETLDDVANSTFLKLPSGRMAGDRRIPLVIWGKIRLQPKGRDEVLEENQANHGRVQKAHMLLTRQALGLVVPKSCMSVVPKANRKEMIDAGLLALDAEEKHQFLNDEEIKDQDQDSELKFGENISNVRNKNSKLLEESKNYKPQPLMILGTLSRVLDVNMKNLRLGLQIRQPQEDTLLFWIMSDYARVSVMGPDEEDLDLMDRLGKDEATVIDEDRERFLDICEKLQAMNGRRVSQEGWYETLRAQVVECQLRPTETLDGLLQVTEPCPNKCGMRIDKLYLARRRLHLYQECNVQAAKNMLSAAILRSTTSGTNSTGNKMNAAPVICPPATSESVRQQIKQQLPNPPLYPLTTEQEMLAAATVLQQNAMNRQREEEFLLYRKEQETQRQVFKSTRFEDEEDEVEPIYYN
ncbi:unnamed protein product [Amoebophrya sp. A120]|nr:unnamed protein product [Amoebophrya sp. A120]|eukprot:GSA120T00024762001.1